MRICLNKTKPEIANISQEDLAAFLEVLGQLSPETRRDAKFVQGAEPGMIINSDKRDL